MKYEDILKHIGVLGKYQKVVISILVLIQLPTACQFLGQVFLAPKPAHWCAIRGDGALNCSQFESTADCQAQQRLLSIPYNVTDDGRLEFVTCGRYKESANYWNDSNEDGWSAGSNASWDGTEKEGEGEVVPCDHGWDFDRTQYRSTINEDFGLVCDREDLPGLAQSIWFAGLLLGSLVWGSVADLLGRRNALRICLTLTAVFSVCVSFAGSFAAFVALRFLTAASDYGLYLVGFVLSSEIVGPKERAKVGTLYNMLFGLGYVVLSALAYFLRDWRHLQLAGALPFLLFLPLLVLQPESPRWYITKRRFAEARRGLERMARVNGTSLPEDAVIDDPDDGGAAAGDGEGSDTVKSAAAPARPTQLDLVRTPNIRRVTVIMGLNWFVVNMVYYGLSLSTSDLGINDYLAAFLSAGTEVPSLLIELYVMERYGRRPTMCFFYLSGGVFCLITIFIPRGAARAAVAMLGKCAATAAFNHVYIYSCELYPTAIRSMGVGFCSMVARVSGILCPIILILQKYWEPLPLCVFGGFSLAAGLASLRLPETRGRNLPDTLEEGEKFAGGEATGVEAEETKNYLPLSSNDKPPPVDV